MNCPTQNREGAEALLAYTAGKLDRLRSATLEEHIKMCPACGEFVRGQNSVWKALDAWEPAPVSPDFDRRLYARIETQVSLWDRILRPFRPLLVRQGLPAAAAAAVVIMAGYLLDRPAGMNPIAAPQAAVMEVAPDQAEPTLQDMETMREFNRLVHPENADSKI
jgi:anti-sigma factor RsiW